MGVVVSENGLMTYIKFEKLDKESFQKALSMLKTTFKGRRFDKPIWKVFTSTKVPEFAKQLKEAGIPVDYTPLEENWEKVWKKAENLLKVKGLYPFQQEGADFLIKHKSAMLLDEMGLGKTVQALAAAGAISVHYPFLVICPAFLVQKWEMEIKRWLKVPVGVVNGKKIDKVSEDTAYVVSVARFQKKDPGDLKDLAEMEWQAVIIDEAHYLKNHRSNRTKNITQILARMMRRNSNLAVYLLTGTPLTRTNPSEIYSLLSLLYPLQAEKNLGFFLKTFAEFDECAGKRFIVGTKNLDELKAIITRFSLRRTAKEVAKQLPSLIRELVPVKATNLDREITKKLEEAVEKIEKEGRTWTVLTQMLKERQGIGLAKAEAVAQLTKNALEEAPKVVVFCEFKETLNKIRKLLEEENINVYVITGETATNKRMEIIQEFKQKDRAVLLGIVKAMGVGLDLDFVRIGIFAELNYSPDVLVQAEKRLHRLTTTEPVVIKYALIDKETEILQKVIDKVEAINNLIGEYDFQITKTDKS